MLHIWLWWRITIHSFNSHFLGQPGWAVPECRAGWPSWSTPTSVWSTEGKTYHIPWNALPGAHPPVSEALNGKRITFHGMPFLEHNQQCVKHWRENVSHSMDHPTLTWVWYHLPVSISSASLQADCQSRCQDCGLSVSTHYPTWRCSGFQQILCTRVVR